jgi:hypothetical protein
MKKLWNIIKLNKEKSLSVLRHVLTGIGAVLITRGWVEESTVQEVIGFVLTLTGLVWSFNDKTQTEE